MKTAIYPGSFDPVTLGHLNIIKRAAAAFDKVIVCVLVNSDKQGLFTPEERMELISKVVYDLHNVEVDSSSMLLSSYAKEKDARVLVKGLRAMSDFEKEFQMAVVNGKLNPELDTVFFPANDKYTFLSSTVVKEMIRYHSDLSEFVPREIIEIVEQKAKDRRGK